MKKILLFIGFILMTGMLYSQQNPTLFGLPKDLSVTIDTNVYDTVSLGTGIKSVTLWNYTGGVLQVSFSKSDGTRDTVNYYTQRTVYGTIYPNRTNTSMYLISSIGGYVKIMVEYGYGPPVIALPYDTSGVSSSVVDTLIYVDSLYSGEPGDTLKSYNTRGYNIAILYLKKVAAADTTEDTIQVYTETATGNYYAIGAKKLYGNIDDTTIAVNSITCRQGAAYFIFNPYSETIVLEMLNNYFFSLRKIYYELHLIKWK